MPFFFFYNLQYLVLGRVNFLAFTAIQFRWGSVFSMIISTSPLLKCVTKYFKIELSILKLHDVLSDKNSLQHVCKYNLLTIF